MITKKYSMLEHALASLRFNRRCFINCDVPEMFLELDHIFPKSLGGKDKDFLLLCSKCNKRKDNRLIEDFLTDEKLKELQGRIALQFTEEQILDELARMIKVELDYIAHCKSNGVRSPEISLGTKRAMQRKEMRQRFAS